MIKKTVESEARIKFWDRIVRLKVETRELETMGESLQDKLRRSKMIIGNEERVVVENGSV